MEKLTPELKKELFDAFKTISLSYEDFEHNLEDSRFTYATCRKYIETENLNITVEFEEERIWSSYEDYEPNNLTIQYMILCADNGEVDIQDLDEEELLNLINY